MSSIPFQARCGACGVELAEGSVLVRRKWIGLQEQIDLVHRRRQGPEHRMGDCGPVIVVGPNEGKIQLPERAPLELKRNMTRGHRRRLVAEKHVKRIRADLALTLRQGSLPWEFGGGGCDFYEEVRKFELALIERAMNLCRGHKEEAGRLLRMNAESMDRRLKRLREGQQRGHKKAVTA